MNTPSAKKLLSVIISCFNEEKTVPIFYREILKVSDKMSVENPKLAFEFIFIDDGSTDKTLDRIRELQKLDSRVRFVSFSRNFGKEAAIFAGLEHAKGDYVTLLDADLQDPPSLLPKMFKILSEQDYDQVATRRVSRQGEPAIRSFFARRFYKLINRLSNVEMVDGSRDYRLMTRQVVNAILSLKEYNRYSKGLFSFVGFKTKWLEYENIKRVAGETKWSFWKLFRYAVEGIVAFSTAPLTLATILGIFISFAAFVIIIFIVVRTAIFGDPVSGWPSTISIILFLSGIQLFCMGVIGQYLSRAYLETKQRPIYIARETEKGKLEK